MKKSKHLKYGFVLLLLIFLVFGATAVIHTLFPGKISGMFSLLNPPDNVYVANQTQNIITDQRSNGWDLAKTFIWVIFALIVVAGIVFLILFAMGKNPAKSKRLTRQQRLEVYTQLLNEERGNIRFQRTTPDDPCPGTFLFDEFYYDKSNHERAAGFFSIYKIRANFPHAHIPSHWVAWIDISAASMDDALTNIRGPRLGQPHPDLGTWEDMKRRQHFGTTGVDSSPGSSEMSAGDRRLLDMLKERVNNQVLDKMISEGDAY